MKPASPYGADFPQGAALKVLVAEDDPSLRLILGKLLGGVVTLRLAEDGLDARQQFEADPPDLLVTDWMMPRMDGLELCRLVKSAPQFCYVILMTAKDALDDKVDALESGADEYLVKPVEPRELFARIRAGARIVALNRKLSDDSRTDKLTGLRNRRAFDEALASEAARSERSGRPFCLLIGDIDDFKSVNDTYGHAVGDEVLAAISRLIEQAIRKGDTAYRLGGDEFAVILPDCPEAGGQDCLGRLAKAVEGFTAPSTRAPLGMSLGMAAFEPGRSTTLDALIRRADERMYGRKRV
jgi:diguanylate cyclase (GGDEF)-like protein